MNIITHKNNNKILEQNYNTTALDPEYYIIEWLKVIIPHINYSGYYYYVLI